MAVDEDKKKKPWIMGFFGVKRYCFERYAVTVSCPVNNLQIFLHFLYGAYGYFPPPLYFTAELCNLAIDYCCNSTHAIQVD